MCIKRHPNIVAKDEQDRAQGNGKKGEGLGLSFRLIVVFAEIN